ncbi:MarR family transcriptional regulator [Microbispora amethystogenes]|uniref:MarR family winged helix-turn-helix transcriptional regulator n=1 Tax=Microbispora amethystogenes TaxID=1427754 RepID=UPI0033C49A8B
MTSETSVGPEVGLLLRLAHQHAAREFTRALSPLGIEGRHFGVLTTLARLGPASQSRLTGELGSDKTAMMRTVDVLEQQGLVVRRPVPGDRRARTVELTSEGRRLLAQASEIAQRVSADLLGGFTPEEQRAFRTLLVRFVALGTPGFTVPDVVGPDPA